MRKTTVVESAANLLLRIDFWKLCKENRWDDGDPVGIFQQLPEKALFYGHGIVWADSHALAAIDATFAEYLGFPPGNPDCARGAAFHAMGAPLAEIFPDMQAMVERFIAHELSPSLKYMDILVWSPAFV